MVAEENCGGADAALLGNLHNGSRAHKRPAGRAERAVSHDVDALVLAKVDDLLLGKAGVVLDLIDGRDDLGMGEKLLEVSHAVLYGLSVH